MRKHLLIILITFFSVCAQSNVLLDLGTTYFSDGLVTPTTTTSAKYFYNVGVLFNLNKQVWGGWSYAGLSYSETSGSTTTGLATTDTGPSMKWQFGKNEIFNLSAAYNILSRGTYTSGSTTENWEGSSIWVQFGICPEVSSGFHVGAAINYYNASFNKKTVSSTESTVANSRTWIFPTLIMTAEF